MARRKPATARRRVGSRAAAESGALVAPASPGQRETVAALQEALPGDVKVIPVPRDAKVSVEVDVNDMAIPYTIALDTRVLIKSLVDQREDLPPMDPGSHRLSWGFAHTLKDWMHKVTLSVDGQKTVLEEKSEAKKDADHSIGVAFLVVS
jgi:hypothetical protein